MSSSSIWFFVNGREFRANQPDPELTLGYYLRNTLGLTGLKLACEEGACGACTVVLGKWNKGEEKAVYRAVNACLVPLYLVDGCAVITVEGVGSAEKIHPIQDRLARGHGTQCGFCSPGFVMSAYALLRNNPHPSMEEIDQAVKGNLCRCTGYRPILEALYSFTTDGCCQGKGGAGGCPCKDAKPDEASKLATFADFPQYDPTQEIIFPPKLIVASSDPVGALSLRGKRVRVECPTELSSLSSTYSQLKSEAGSVKIASSGVMTRLVASFSPSPAPQLWLSLHRIPVMHRVETRDGRVSVGAACTVTELVDALCTHCASISAGVRQLFSKYSAEQVKNAVSWSGALASASASSEVCSLLLALDATVTVLDMASGEESSLCVSALFSSPGKTCLRESQAITAVEVPTEGPCFLSVFKQGERHGPDSTLVNAVCCIRLSLSHTVEKARLVAGVERKPIVLEKTGKLCEARSPADLAALPPSTLFAAIDEDLKQCGAVNEHKTRLVRAAILEMVEELNGKAAERDNGPIESTQIYKAVDSGDLGRPLAHQWADRHTTGEAKYVGDVDGGRDTLHLAFVQSTLPHAKVLKIDPSAALAIEGVVAYVDERDIPSGGSNVVNGKLFAAGEVESIGQLIGCVIAEDVVTARRAAKLVKVEYEPLPHVLSIDDAIAAESLLCEMDPTGVEVEEVEAALEKCDKVICGSASIGGQEHLYMETNQSLVIPGENGEWLIHTSSQQLGGAHEKAAKCLGVAHSQVVVKMRRAGGAFGGKTSQDDFPRLAALVAANKLKKPISAVLSRAEDIGCTGKRHPVKTVYKVGFSSGGKLQAAYWKHYVDGGYSMDSSRFVTMAVRCSADVIYDYGVMRGEGYTMKTHKHSNNAFRGFGQPQIAQINEQILTRVAHETGKHIDEIRELNFRQPGTKVLSGSVIMNEGMLDAWRELHSFAKVVEMRKQVDEWNSSHPHVKRGLAVGTTRFGMTHAGPFEQAEVLLQVHQDGSVALSFSGCELGQGLNTKLLQVASKALDLPLSRITTLGASTDKAVNGPVTGGSQGADVHGLAVMDACKQIRASVDPMMKETDGDWDKAVKLCYEKQRSLQASGHGFVDRSLTGLPPTAYTYFTTGAAAVVAEGDGRTGEQRLISVDIVMDVGESLNPAVDIGQIEGGFMQGYGLVSSEDLVYDYSSGKLLTNSAYTYKIPTAAMAPKHFRVKLMRDVPNWEGQVYSSKGIGEPPLLLCAVAYSAIRDAVVAIRQENGISQFLDISSPLTATKILHACHHE